jgi:hypothetical protein
MDYLTIYSHKNPVLVINYYKIDDIFESISVIL